MTDRAHVLDTAEHYLCPDRVRTLRGLGADLVIGRREGYRIWDVDGRELLDLHLNGGTFNLGHRNPELVDVLVRALDDLDIGNHHFPSPERAALAERLVLNAPISIRETLRALEAITAHDYDRGWAATDEARRLVSGNPDLQAHPERGFSVLGAG